MAGSGGPWGGGSGDDEDRPPRNNGGGRRPGGNQPLPEIDELVRKGTDKLRVLMGGKGGGGGGNFGQGQGGGEGGGGGLPRNGIALGLLAAVGLWAFNSFYSVRPEEKSVELFLGKCLSPCVGEPGLNFAPWPVYSYKVIPVTVENTEDIGVGQTGGDEGLMLTRDENIVDIDFQVVWNVTDPEKYLFNLRDPDLTIRAVAESSMREIIAQSQLAPILNRDRGSIAMRLREMIQKTLDSYNSGMNVVRVNFKRADPPREVIAAFKEVQSAEQERDRLQKEADAYSNKVVAGARGDAAAVLEAAKAYSTQVINQAQGEASRFSAIRTEYDKAPEVTRERLYLETMEQVMGGMNKLILDGSAGGGQGVLPYLPLNGLSPAPAGTAKPAAGGSN